MEKYKDIISQLSDKAKTELVVFAQSQPEIINPFIDEELEDPQTELDVLYELGFLDFDGDEEDEEYARAEFASDVRQYLSEEIGNVKADTLISKVLDVMDEYDNFAKDAPNAYSEIQSFINSKVQVQPMNIVIFGPPLAGKGTHTKFIQDKFGMDVVSTGAMLREHIKNGTFLGQKIKPIMDAGQLIDVDDVMGVIEEAFFETSPDKGVIFDGTPRRLEEFFKLMAILQSDGETIDKIIVLDVPEDELFRRMEKRKAETIATGKEPRSDDDPDVLKDRLIKYRDESFPVIEAAKQFGIEVVVIQGDKDISLVQDEISKVLDKDKFSQDWDYNHFPGL